MAGVGSMKAILKPYFPIIISPFIWRRVFYLHPAEIFSLFRNCSLEHCWKICEKISHMQGDLRIFLSWKRSARNSGEIPPPQKSWIERFLAGYKNCLNAVISASCNVTKQCLEGCQNLSIFTVFLFWTFKQLRLSIKYGFKCRKMLHLTLYQLPFY